MSKHIRTIRFIIAVIILAVFTSSVVAVIRFKKQQENAEPPIEYVSMPNSVLPDVSFLYENMHFNSVQGYAQEMDMNLVRGTITPVSSEMKVPVSVKVNGSNITAILFQIRSIGDGKLLEDSKVNDWSLNGKQISLQLPLSTLIQKDTEYLLDLILTTENHGDIHYYTRIKCGEHKSLLTLLQFAKDFSEATFTKKESILVPYMLNKLPKTEDNLAYVDLNSRYVLLTWGGINPTKIKDYDISITEIGEEQISINLKYKVKVVEADNSTVEYDVNEFYCLRMRGKQVYILNYFRTMEESVHDIVMNAGKVNLGMIEQQPQLVSSEKGEYTAFTYKKGLWLYEKETNELSCLYSDAGIGNQSYDIQIASVQTDGTVTFAVYGYIARGEFEGKNLLCWFIYDRETNSLKRVFHIPLEQTYEFLVGEQLLDTYGTKNGDCYLRLNEGIYCVKAGSDTLEVIADDILENSFFQNEMGNIIAWQDKEKIAIFNMETNEMKKIKAKSGEFISIQGLDGNNVVYGIGNDTDKGILLNGEEIKPFHTLVIMNEKGEERHRYNSYIENTTIETGKIVINRLEKTEDGVYERISYDVLLSDANSIVNTYAKVSTVKEKYKNRVVLQITGASESTGEIKGKFPKIVKQDKELGKILLENQTILSGKYQVYAGGGLVSQTNDIGEAIQVAFDKAGTVTGNNLFVYWFRSVRRNYVLLPYENRQNDDPNQNLVNCIEVMVQTLGGNADFVKEAWDKSHDVEQTLDAVLELEVMNIRGIKSAEMLYYIDQKSPVLIQLGEDSSIMLVGYSGNNIMVYDSSGTLRTMTQEMLENVMKGDKLSAYVCIQSYR